MINKSGLEMVKSLSDDKRDLVKSLISYSSLGLEMGLCVAIGIAIGYFLDRYFMTSPYLTIIFMIFGIVAAMKSIYQLMKKLEKENERNKDK
ncbi:MAG TPA: AtpZ/AtpI family protein [Syntrophorhabdus sp.]|jgi:ATP synthase protein I|nr:AtpZ/AtpI family protein [Syntrophorhabdus sp.]OPX92867.1 MAG: putative F0F1-ATPase [Syntrophorhabdus sp. PtaB.Bin027]OQB76992.1 MAG: putative F0F1-ATPase [Deltaproteobacteria bacterium ADurb.Bin135]MBP8743580.1 AtpZ/AtpI family protein [Syntrophorhabdus sp.]HNQ46150.1 AtpZ/AtpI family protein [Syntrophorhabdus sp.]